MSDDRQLVVLIEGLGAGLLTVDRSGRLTFRYDDSWLNARQPTPLSLSMPVAEAEHGDCPAVPAGAAA